LLLPHALLGQILSVKDTFELSNENKANISSFTFVKNSLYLTTNRKFMMRKTSSFLVKLDSVSFVDIAYSGGQTIWLKEYKQVTCYNTISDKSELSLPIKAKDLLSIDGKLYLLTGNDFGDTVSVFQNESLKTIWSGNKPRINYLFNFDNRVMAATTDEAFDVANPRDKVKFEKNFAHCTQLKDTLYFVIIQMQKSTLYAMSVKSTLYAMSVKNKKIRKIKGDIPERIEHLYADEKNLWLSGKNIYLYDRKHIKQVWKNNISDDFLVSDMKTNGSDTLWFSCKNYVLGGVLTEKIITCDGKEYKKGDSIDVTIEFDTDSDRITTNNAKLDSLISLLKDDISIKCEIIGFKEPTGKFKLAEGRANSVKNYILKDKKIDSMRITARGSKEVNKNSTNKIVRIFFQF
jgi:hypothetical protein